MGEGTISIKLRVGMPPYGTCVGGKLLYRLQYDSSELYSTGSWKEEISLQQYHLSLKT
jgi:hypothetical protein